jgi:hypothetical protein
MDTPKATNGLNERGRPAESGESRTATGLLLRCGHVEFTLLLRLLLLVFRGRRRKRKTLQQMSPSHRALRSQLGTSMILRACALTAREMHLDVPDRHPARMQRSDLVEPGKPCLALRHTIRGSMPRRSRGVSIRTRPRSVRSVFGVFPLRTCPPAGRRMPTS